MGQGVGVQINRATGNPMGISQCRISVAWGIFLCYIPTPL